MEMERHSFRSRLFADKRSFTAYVCRKAPGARIPLHPLSGRVRIRKRARCPFALQAKMHVLRQCRSRRLLICNSCGIFTFFGRVMSPLTFAIVYIMHSYPMIEPG